jgi:hypothetical protein
VGPCEAVGYIGIGLAKYVGYTEAVPRDGDFFGVNLGLHWLQRKQQSRESDQVSFTHA